MWIDSTRPASISTTATAAFGGPDHYVQHPAVVLAELRGGEVIRLGHNATNTNTGRRQFVVATDQRVFALSCNYFRRTKTESVESINYDENETPRSAAVAGSGAQSWLPQAPRRDSV